MDAEDDFETWKLCWEVSRLFQKERFFPPSADNLCIGCDKKSKPWSSKHRSEFVQLAVKCSAKGHLDSLRSSDADVCMRCNPDFVVKVVKREQTCPEDKCRRVLTVDKKAVVKKLEGRGLLAAKFLSLISKFETFECLVHGDASPLSLAHNLSAPENCNHEANICSKGLREVMKLAVDDGRLQDVRCPDPDCSASYSNKDIRRILSKESFVKYNHKLGLREMKKDPNFRCCQGKGCDNGQIVQRNAGELDWQCVICKTWNCFDCVPNTCERHKKEKAEDAVNEELLNRTTKRCPKRGCTRRIEYMSGCAHMTCRESVANGCGAEFCWICKVIWMRQPGPKGKLIASHLKSCCLRSPSSDPASRPGPDDADYSLGWDTDPGYDKSLDKDMWLPGYQR